MRIAIDMDDVIADFSEKDLRTFNKLFNKEVTQEEVGYGYVTQKYPEYEDVMVFIRNNADFFRDMKVMPDAKRVIERLAKKHEIFIVTAAMHFSNSIHGKIDWLKSNFPFIDKKHYVFCGDKSIINTDYLIDDSLENLSVFSGKGLLFSAHHNLDKDYDDIRVNSWLEVEAYFEEEGLI